MTTQVLMHFMFFPFFQELFPSLEKLKVVRNRVDGDGGEKGGKAKDYQYEGSKMAYSHLYFLINFWANPST